MAESSIVFLVDGHSVSAGETTARGAAAPEVPAALRRGRLKAAVRVGATRDAGQVRLEAVPGEDTVVLHIANGPQLMLRPETARDLMLAQSTRARGRTPREGGEGSRLEDEDPPTEVTIPATVSWAGLERGVATRGAARGFLGDAMIALVEIVTGAAPDLAAGAIVEKVDAQVAEGVYELKRGTLPPLKGTASPVAIIPGGDAPVLVFVHGTFSNTSGTFSRLWSEHPQRVEAIFTQYDGRVYGLEHHTLGKSPVENALMLARALPPGTRLHLVTHSRGGLVAEVLARTCGGQPVADADLREFTAKDRDALKELARLGRDIHLERVVRVACPARGTLLASKRLDAYLSVIKWTMELGGVPIGAAFLDFLAAVAQRREDPDKIPGLAAQIPDSALVKWLHAVDGAVPGELRVVAGDLEGDSVVSWLKTLLADSFYWTDNDLVVQTSSMYGGAPRAQGATFLLDQGGGVSHFNYFGNTRTAQAIVDAITLASPPNFARIGPLSWQGEDASGVRGAGDASDAAAALRPAVFVLPGILGSNLKDAKRKRIWLHLRIVGGLDRIAYDPRGDGVTEDGPVENVYSDLCGFLERTHHVVPFGYDWRKPLEEAARLLADAITRELDARVESKQPVRILAHSMGGLLARTVQLVAPEVWKRMMDVAGARMLMLGTPNGGSWAPMQVLSGDDKFGNGLVAIGAPFQDDKARMMMAAFPGFIQLQAALLDDGLKLKGSATWKKLADDDLELVRRNNWWHDLGIQLNEYKWGVPPQGVLDQAVKLRERLDAQSADELAAFSDRMLLVVGKAKFTPDGFEINPDGLGYRNAQDSGDGRVTLASARLRGVQTWKLDCEHGNLPKESDAYEAYVELLATGRTSRLDMLAGMRGAIAADDEIIRPTAHVRSRPSRVPTSTRPPQTQLQMLSSPEPGAMAAAVTSPDASIGISVVNGDLKFVHRPLLLGHYSSEKLFGTEWVMDRLIGGAMTAALKLRVYPESPGDHKVFMNTRLEPDNPRRLPRPEGVVVVGLGDEGKLRADEITETVKRGAIAWSQRLVERSPQAPPDFDLAATLIGSGGSGISAGQSAQQVADGVRQANDRLAERGLPRVRHLEFIEIYLDRASEALRALQVQAAAHPSRYQVAPEIREGAGGLRRPIDQGYRGADYDFITAVTRKDALGDTTIVYTLDTKRARTEVRAQATQGKLLESLIVQASNIGSVDTQIPRTLFKLLIPVEMEPFMSGTTALVMQLDRGTAAIPWELLDADSPDSEEVPWAIRASLLRKLQTPDFRPEVTDARHDASVLVIGEPRAHARYARLPGARAEANAVVALLTAQGELAADYVTALISPDDERQPGPDERAIMNALLGSGWRVVHISGHGELVEMIGPVPKKRGDPPQTPGDPRGVVLANDTYLGPREIRAMRTVPELVFVNCCHLGSQGVASLVDADELGGAYDRPRFAASVAEELIRIGVKCVVAAGWAVDDEAARVFATKFYETLLRKRPFIEAVSSAREAARACGGNTWAAYQCYGDPDWHLRRDDDSADAARRTDEKTEVRKGVAAVRAKSMPDLFAGVTSWRVLEIALETLAVESTFQGKAARDQRMKIQYLENRYGASWGKKGAVAEAFAIAWNATGERRKAISWYAAAVAAADGGASLRAAEQLANLGARVAQEDVVNAKAQGDAESFAAAVIDAKAKLAGAIEGLQRLVSIQPTIERESLLASAYKRQAMVLAAAGEPDVKAIASMQRHYRRAEEIAREQSSADLFYPAMNRMAAELALNAGKRGWKGLDPAELDEVRECLARRVRDDPDFWSVVALIELRIYDALSQRRLAASFDVIRAELEDLQARVPSKSHWATVRDQARFVLARYDGRVPAADARALAALLNLLERFT